MSESQWPNQLTRESCPHLEAKCVDCGDTLTATTPDQSAATVGRIIDEHYRARRAADPSGPPVHECGSYCGADIATRLASVR